MFFTRLLSPYIKTVHKIMESWTLSKNIAIISLLSALSAILQSAGGLLPGIGLLISPFSTLPILLATTISLKYGFPAYLLTNILLILIEPSELLIFAFTTGLLGLGIGLGLRILNHRFLIIAINAIILSLGICFPLYGLGFPILGPALSTTPEIKSLITIFIFATFYSWLWLEFGLYILRLLYKFLSIKK